MNILHITTFLQGGAGRIIYDLATHQSKMNNDVTVVTSKTSEPGYCNYQEYLTGLEENNISTYKIDSTFKRDLYLNLKVVKEVREIIKKRNIDIIHAHASIPALVGVIARTIFNKYIPIVQTMHGWGTNKTKQHEFMDSTIMNGIDLVVPVSKTSKNLLINKGVKKDNIKVIYNGIEDKNTYNENDKDLNAIKQLKEEGFKIIGSIGTISKRKNQKLLVKAFKKVEEQFDKSICIFIGEGDLIKDLKTMAENINVNEKVRFYGYKKNASQFIKYFDVLVLPSLSEGLPITVLEGFREGIPVIGSDIPEIKEIIKDNHNGFLFKSNDSTSLKIVINKVLNSSKENIVEITNNANNFYLNNFKINIMADNYLILYKRLIYS